MSSPATKLLDCRGMQCPTPILHIATAARTAGSTPTVLEILVDDDDFPKDVEAWCRTSKSRLIDLVEKGGVIRAHIGLNGAESVAPPLPSPPSGPLADPANAGRGAQKTPAPASRHRVDCRGMRCPAPILAISKFARTLEGKTAFVEVLADDSEFPSDLKAWCRTSRNRLLDLSVDASGIRAVLGINESPLAPSSKPEAPESATMRTAPRGRPPTPPSVRPGTLPSPLVLDFRGLVAPQPVLRLSNMLATQPGSTVTVHADDPGFMTDVMGWAAATKVSVHSAAQQSGITTVTLQLGSAPVETESAALPSLEVTPPPLPRLAPSTPAEAPSPGLLPATSAALAPIRSSEVARDEAAQENRLTILVIRNDFESLMAAMLCATTAAAQGLEAVMYFSFWGVNILRGERPRRDAQKSKASFLQRMMKWMMPRGPKRQKMSKMHMGGMGKGMMQYFMRKNNVMSLEQMIESAVKQDVRFVVCTMSMGIMGIEKRDLMDLPNIEYAGVTSFVELSQRSKSTLVF